MKWDKHERNISEAFQSLRKDEHFCDVTLACGDHQFQAHKVVLSAGSSFFEQVLKRHKHPNPLLYLKGVDASHIELLLDFMYSGEVSVKQWGLESLMQTAEELGVRGLASPVPSTTLNRQNPERSNPCSENTGNLKELIKDSLTQGPSDSVFVPVPTNKSVEAADSMVGSLMLEDSETTIKSEEPQSYTDFDGPKNHMIEEWEDLRKYVISISEKEASGKVVRSHKCSLCGKILSRSNAWHMMAHVESMHFKGALVHTCSICQKVCVTKYSLVTHKKAKH